MSSKGTTKYQWGFAKKIAQEDKDRVESVRDSIDTMTNVKFANEVSRLTGKSTAGALDSGLGLNGAPRRPLGPSFPPSSEPQRLSRRPMTADDGKRNFMAEQTTLIFAFEPTLTGLFFMLFSSLS